LREVDVAITTTQKITGNTFEPELDPLRPFVIKKVTIIIRILSLEGKVHG